MRIRSGFEIIYKFGSARYEISVANPDGVSCGVVGLILDGQSLPHRPAGIPLADDGQIHQVRLILG